jgi:dTDP-4-dehydrorhamnose reductase
MPPDRGARGLDGECAVHPEQDPIGTLELWAGAECTVNRVRNTYFDQLDRTGHAVRLDDLDRLAALGARRIRFPILWERTAPRGLAGGDFAWSDLRLRRLEELGIEPIVGLVHHGSGPTHTNLCELGFASGLAAFAHTVATRYPSIEAYTPVNEPLTTARFSGLYGHWYPHERCLEAFVAALMNQIHATRLAMAAIRRINPAAQLYQTEDLGRVFGTPNLAKQCEYESHRRWLSLDLLFGRVGREHPLRKHLEQHGAEPRWLDEWAAEPCAPDLVGINYYVTSDRFLDSRLQRYPPHTWGGNGRDTYSDVEAVRARPEGIAGHGAVIEETWARYGTAVALTEVHLACHREEQLRWLREAWEGARAARAGGADVRALTIWSVFGAVGWSNLVTSASGEYEPGAYDVRAPEPRPTAVAQLARALASGGDADSQLRGAGWWRRVSRLACSEGEASEQELRQRPCLIVVGSGAHARRIAELCGQRFECLRAPTCAAAERLVRPARGATVANRPPWAVVLAFDPTRGAPELRPDFEAQWAALAKACATPLRLLALSCDRMFDGWGERPYLETDRPDCRDRKSASWSSLERAAARACAGALIVRSGFRMDPQQPGDTLLGVLESLQRHDAPELETRVTITLSYLPQLVDAALDLLIDGETGTWHLATRSSCSPFELARRCAERLALPFHAQPLAFVRQQGRGPMRAMASGRGWPLPDLPAAVEAYARAYETFRAAQAARLHVAGQ